MNRKKAEAYKVIATKMRDAAKEMVAVAKMMRNKIASGRAHRHAVELLQAADMVCDWAAEIEGEAEGKR